MNKKAKLTSIIIGLSIAIVSNSQKANATSLRGAYLSDGTLVPASLAGDCRGIVGGCAPGSEFDDIRNFFVFDVSNIAVDLTSNDTVTLEFVTDAVDNNGFVSTSGEETFQLFDVTTDIISLINGTGGIAAHEDLGTGIFYGDVTIPIPENNPPTSFTVQLNDAGIAAINEARNTTGLFAVGGIIDSLNSEIDDEFILGFEPQEVDNDNDILIVDLDPANFPAIVTGGGILSDGDLVPASISGDCRGPIGGCNINLTAFNDIRNFLVFDVSSFPQDASTITLELEQNSPDGFQTDNLAVGETFEIRGLSDPTIDLLVNDISPLLDNTDFVIESPNTEATLDAFNEFATSTLFGTQTVTDNGDIIIELNQDGIEAFNTARNSSTGLFGIGGIISTLNDEIDDEFILGFQLPTSTSVSLVPQIISPVAVVPTLTPTSSLGQPDFSTIEANNLQLNAGLSLTDSQGNLFSYQELLELGLIEVTSDGNFQFLDSINTTTTPVPETNSILALGGLITLGLTYNRKKSNHNNKKVRQKS